MGGKVLEDDPGQRTHIQGVRLDNFARLSGLVRLGLRYSVGPWPLAFPGPDIKPQPLARCAR